MSQLKTIQSEEIEELILGEVSESVLRALKKMHSDDLKETILKGTKAEDNSNKADRLIEEFARQAVEKGDSDQPLSWIRIRAEELGRSGSYEDLRDAARVNYFRLGFLVSWFITRRLEVMDDA